MTHGGIRIRFGIYVKHGYILVVILDEILELVVV